MGNTHTMTRTEYYGGLTHTSTGTESSNHHGHLNTHTATHTATHLGPTWTETGTETANGHSHTQTATETSTPHTHTLTGTQSSTLQELARLRNPFQHSGPLYSSGNRNFTPGALMELCSTAYTTQIKNLGVN